MKMWANIGISPKMELQQKNAFVRKNMAENNRWCGVLGCAETIRQVFL